MRSCSTGWRCSASSTRDARRARDARHRDGAGPEALIAISTLRGASCLLGTRSRTRTARTRSGSSTATRAADRAASDEPYITPHVPTDGEVLEADVVVVGSGAGGGTIAGVLATQGKKVVVLEAAGRPASATTAARDRGEPGDDVPRRDRRLGRRQHRPARGATLGGGTTINWHNCVKPSAEVRREWAQDWAWRTSTARSSTATSRRCWRG
jgi:hypothetical protein